MRRGRRGRAAAAVLVVAAWLVPCRAAASTASVDEYQVLPRPVAAPSWQSVLAPGSTAVSAAGPALWFLDPKLGHLVRLDAELRVRESAPLPAGVIAHWRQQSGTTVHLAPFPGGCWLLEPGRGEARRYSGEEWHGPFRPGLAFSTGAARAEDELLLNTPEEARPFALYRPSDGRLRPFGRAAQAPHPELRSEYGSWVVGASPHGWVAAHRFLPILASFDEEGRQRWSETVRTASVDRLAQSHQREVAKAVAAGSECCISVELVHLAESVLVRDDASVLINYSASPRLAEVSPEGKVVREIVLLGEEVRSLDRFGFAAAGGKIVAAVGGALRVFEPAVRARLQGKVVDERGEPIAGARIALEAPDGMRSSATGADGLFWLPRTAEAVTLNVEATGYLPLELRGFAAEILRHDVVLQREPALCLRVVDGRTGEPVARYRVSIARHLSTASSVSTQEGPELEVEDEEGRTCLSAPFQPPFLLVVTAEGYARWDRRLAAVSEVEVELGPEARLALEVRSEDGAPIAGADAVLADPEVVTRLAWAESFGASSDTAGEVLLSGVTPGPWMLVVRHSDFLEERRLVELEARTNEIRVALSTGSRAEVRVAHTRGQPLPGATVSLEPAASVRSTMQQCVTDDAGRCGVARLERGRYRLAVEWRPGALVSRSVVIDAADQAFEVEVGAGAEVEGRLLGFELYGDARFAVAVRTAEGGVLEAAADATGRFVLDGVEPESWAEVTVRASVEGSAAPWTVLTTAVRFPPPGESLELELPEPVAVSGRVTEGGRPCGRCRIVLRAESAAIPSAVRLTTSPDGSYRALLAATGSYLAVVDGSRGPSHRGLDVTGSGRYDIELDDASIRGRVVLAADGSGIDHAAIALRRDDGTSVATTFSGSDGGFAFSGLSDGAYRLSAHHDEGVAARQLSVAPASTEEVTLELEAREALRLRLLDAETGAAVVRGALRLYDARGSLVFERHFSDAGGDVEIPVAGGGPFVAVVRAHGFGLTTLFDLAPEEPRRVVALRQASTLVVAPGAETDAFALLDPQGRPVALSFDRPPGVVVLGDRPLMFPDVAVGSHHLSAGGRRQVVDLVAGRQTMVDL